MKTRMMDIKSLRRLVATVAAAGLAIAVPSAHDSIASDSSGRQTPTQVDVLDVRRLPLGDGRVSPGPAQGMVMSCRLRFRQTVNLHAGPWINGDTWDLTAKPTVRGQVTWPAAEFAISTTGTGRVVSRVLRGNGLPVDTPTGGFPIARRDPAYAFDRNPNGIAAQDVVLTLPRDPTPASRPTCVPMGMVGVALNGVAIYNALDDAGMDAVAHEVQDLCSGHPQARGEYHYHGPSPCLPNQTAPAALIGYAMDGFGIFSTYDANGREITNADLDACHGRVDEIDWDGRRVEMYHYVLTREYPYTVGCFTGTPVWPAR